MGYFGFDAGPVLVALANSAPSNLFGLPAESAKFFPCHTYEKRADKSFVCHTHKNQGLKVFCFSHLRNNPPPATKSGNQELA